MNDVSLRRMTEGDLTAADALRRLAGWNQTPEKWRCLLRVEPQGCFVAEHNGEVIGTVTATTYGQALAWIGMMLVHPAHQRRGIGTRLIRQVLEYLQHRAIACIKLDATPLGQPVYEKVGFVAESTLTRYQRLAGSERRTPGNADTRDLSDADWEAVERLDTPAFGACRLRLLRSLATLSRAALVWPAQGRVLGWGVLRRGANADHLGPLVCGSAEGSRSLVAALLDVAGNGPVVWDVLDQNEAAKAAAGRFGFTPIRTLTRMRLGPNSVTGDPQSQFAIVDPAVG
ncbi:MAG: GNAT family N-acetyltransferase [Limisphaerales bacterium]